MLTGRLLGGFRELVGRDDLSFRNMAQKSTSYVRHDYAAAR
jgi:hypothetical protein